MTPFSLPVLHSTPDFFQQRIRARKWTDPSRRPGFFGQYIQGDKRTLHIGCSDYPLRFNPQENLHVRLGKYTRNLDGFDLNTDQFSDLAMHVPGMYLSDPSHLVGFSWDVCLVPETIEHVENIGEFLRALHQNVNAGTFVISAPNAFGNRAPQWEESGEYLVETVHPDHRVWFSPYTLAHAVRTAVPEWTIRELWLIENESQVVVVCDKTT